MRPSRGMGAIAPSKMPKVTKKRDGNEPVALYAKGGGVNAAGNYTKPGMRKKLFESIKAGNKGGDSGQWSARKAQMLALKYKANGGGYRD
jgi:hypothetical protein